MAKKKVHQSFFKVKEKLVLIPPKKYFGKKIIGVVCLVLGSLLIAGSLLFFYVIPIFFPPKTEIVQVEKEKLVFFPQRILILKQNLDLSVENGEIIFDLPLKITEPKKGEEIIVLAQSEFQDFKITGSKTENILGDSILEISGLNLKLTLQTQIKPPKLVTIEAERNEK
ncbi:hypothetical protein COT64_01685 [Candidatus Shapirobacteria bacterium CG09_land_8_20_14_0_10_39_12]|uniref:Uncharacterized protein n=1 Tax=Candidatus Shapirobacteria bacterium CG09_land_8_20_14_0_10_39_12 TaxID=1974885 RepID=A0A2H0WPP4_9BACT|nr:MAG: hypothetical protein COT64_01685 [Candidatus Shapirobacteria bacterium CG09_land_8_20_14_0_10_39_12]